MKPKVFTLEPERVFWDSVASDFREIRFIGHTYVRDKEDLLKEAQEGGEEDGWIIDAIKASAESARADVGSSKRERREVNRKELRIREVWIPEHNDLRPEGDEGRGFHGTLYTMVESGEGDGGSGVFIREPQPFYGPESGPYVMWGVYPVMGETFPLSPLMVVEPQVSRLNDLSLAYSNAARKAKKGFAVPAYMEDAAEQFKNFHDQSVFLAEIPPEVDIRSVVSEIELGGPAEKLLEYMQVERERLERTSGLSDAQRGSVTGQGTATEVAIADSASSVRVDFVKKRFTAAVQQIFEKVAWYFMEDDRSRYVLSPSIAEKYGMDPNEPLFYRPPEDDIPFDAYEFEIEPYSMERVSEGMHQKRIMDFLGIYTQLVPLAAQFPGAAPWNELAKKLAEAANIPDVGTMIDEAQAAQVGAEMQAMGANPQAGPQGAPGGSLPMMPGPAMGGGMNGGLI
jgi:hypothetical protein